MSRRLLNCVRTPDTVSRQGGDEFVLLLQDLREPEDAAATARRVLQAVSEVHLADHPELRVTASVGVSVYPDDGLDAETLIKNADTAMYQAKKNGRQGCEFYSNELKVCTNERQFTMEDLRRALEQNELTLHYQPKVDLKTGTITGAEALSRWIHPTRGTVPPGQFIPIAEQSGLIMPFGAWVFSEACTQARAWADAGRHAKTMAVNVSGAQFQSRDFLDGLFETLSKTGLDPEFLELDVNERVLMSDPERTVLLLKTLKDRGVQVSADNFGTGDSSLSSMRKLPLKALKIDRSIVRQITTVPGGTTTSENS
jgi:predicted signal transduction protein with EAL and GGDEF domain